MSPPSQEEILIIGEIIRLKMHKDPSLIKDRRYHLRTYTCCFVGREVVEWLVKNDEAITQSSAISCMKILQDNGILHHGQFLHKFILKLKIWPTCFLTGIS